MPKLRERTRRRDPVYELLKGRQVALSMTDKDFGAQVDWSPATTTRKNKPDYTQDYPFVGDWAFEDVIKLAKKMQIPLEDLCAAIRY